LPRFLLFLAVNAGPPLSGLLTQSVWSFIATACGRVIHQARR
jgi:hypothetical protein